MDLATPYDIVQLTQVASTQDEAAERFGDSGMATLVIADRQVAGRGRQGRDWVQPDRALFSSFAFHSTWPMDRKTLIPLMAAVAVANAIDDACGVSVGLKWPNDLLAEGKKTGGILVETSSSRVTVGCGLNLWWDDPVDGATSLFRSDPGREVGLDLANGWVQGLQRMLAGGPDGWDNTEYVSRSVTIGHSVAWDGGEGVAVGIGPDGSLLVGTDTGEVAIHAGDVHLRGSR